jgi:RNA polymerase sigma factor (sigma-70 family)
VRAEEGIDAERAADLVVAAIGRLSAEDRDLLALFSWQGCSYQEIATALGIPPGTVGSRINRIRVLLRIELPEGVSG